MGPDLLCNYFFQVYMGDVQASHSADCQEETCQPWQHPREFVEVIIHYKYTNDKVEGHKRFERKGNF